MQDIGLCIEDKKSIGLRIEDKKSEVSRPSSEELTV